MGRRKDVTKNKGAAGKTKHSHLTPDAAYMNNPRGVTGWMHVPGEAPRICFDSQDVFTAASAALETRRRLSCRELTGAPFPYMSP